jgi:hypothetical protein
MRAHHSARVFLAVCLWFAFAIALHAQTTTASIEGTTRDASGALLPRTTVTAVNTGTGFTRSTVSSDSGSYQLLLLPVGEYTVTAEQKGFQKQLRRVRLELGAAAVVDFALAVGQVTQEVEVRGEAEAVEPTRSMISSVIAEREIQSLPVNGRQFIDFALLAPGVTIGDTTSGSTDVIIEPVTKLSFAGQNIHFNFVAIDGADNISTASGIQKTAPSQEGVQEFRVINSSYSTEFGRAVGGIVNIITKSGTNTFHGSVYEYFRNDKLDAKNPLVSPNLSSCAIPGDPFSGGCQPMDKLRQNQFGFTLGGPIRKDRTFVFGNYEGQRHRESPFYNSVILQHLDCNSTIDPQCGTSPRSINEVKTQVFGLPAENLNVTRDIDYDNFLVKLDHTISPSESLMVRYFFNDQRSTNLSPLNDGFDLPSGFKNNNFRDQSLVGSLTSTLSNSFINDLRVQYAHRFFDFPTVSTQPHLEVTNTFTVGVNRGNPDFYEEGRWEVTDSVTKILGKHTLSFGGDTNHVNTTESFPLFYPFEADFADLNSFLGTDFVGAPHPFVIFFERFQAPNFSEPTFSTSVYQGGAISQSIRNQAKGEIAHTYNGLYIQDKWRATSKLTLNYGLRWEFETWPSAAINNPMKNFDPRAGLSYALGTKRNLVIRAGAGLFHGIIPSPLLMCQIPSCGGVVGAFPGREGIQDGLNATTRLSAFGTDPFTMATALGGMLKPGLVTASYPLPALDAVIVRFAKDHKPPYGAQASLGIGFEPFRDAVLDVSYLHVRGIHLGSFYNVNQPDPTGQVQLHDSKGNVGPKNLYCTNFPCQPPVILPGVRCTRFNCPIPPGAPPDYLGFAVDFEADSRWDSQYDGLLVNFNKRPTHHIGLGISYTFSKGIDNGPNPSFVLIPQDSSNFRAERAVSSDSVKHRFVANATFTTPEKASRLVRGWELGTILTFESPHYFTKFAGFDSNGDIFGNNDRVGIEPRNTFQGDGYQSVDLRVSRTFGLSERVKLQTVAEGFNMLNVLNVRFFNTAYGAADFCPIGGAQGGCPAGGPLFFEGSPNSSYGTPRAVFNPRQIQLALRVTW